MNRSTLEVLEPSLISEMAHRATLPKLETWVSTPRAFTNTEPSKAAPVASRKPVTRSHRHHSEAK
jgi:hypothetical protein